MKMEQVMAAIESTPKGANVVMEWQSEKTPRKGVTAKIEKYVRMVGRIGIDYNNRGVVIEKRENGELPETPQPIWNGKGVWDIFPFLFHHADTGKQYLRFYPGTSEKLKAKSEWYLDGKLVPLQQVAPMLTKKDLPDPSDTPPDCFCVGIESVLRIHDEVSYLPMNEESEVEQEKETKKETELQPQLA